MSQDTEGVEDGKEIVKYSAHQSDVFVGILLKGHGPLVAVNAMQHIPFDHWNECSMISVNKDEKALRCALYNEEEAKIYVFDNMDDTENAKPQTDLNLIADYFDDRHIDKVVGSKNTVDGFCEGLGKSRSAKFIPTKVEPGLTLLYVESEGSLPKENRVDLVKASSADIPSLTQLKSKNYAKIFKDINETILCTKSEEGVTGFIQYRDLPLNMHSSALLVEAKSSSSSKRRELITSTAANILSNEAYLGVVVFSNISSKKLVKDCERLGFKTLSDVDEYTVEQKSLLDGVGSTQPRLRAATRNRVSYKKKKLPTREFIQDKRKSVMEDTSAKKPTIAYEVKVDDDDDDDPPPVAKPAFAKPMLPMGFNPGAIVLKKTSSAPAKPDGQDAVKPPSNRMTVNFGSKKPEPEPQPSSPVLKRMSVQLPKKTEEEPKAPIFGLRKAPTAVTPKPEVEKTEEPKAPLFSLKKSTPAPAKPEEKKEESKPPLFQLKSATSAPPKPVNTPPPSTPPKPSTPTTAPVIPPKPSTPTTAPVIPPKPTTVTETKEEQKSTPVVFKRTTPAPSIPASVRTEEAKPMFVLRKSAPSASAPKEETPPVEPKPAVQLRRSVIIPATTPKVEEQESKPMFVLKKTTPVEKKEEPVNGESVRPQLKPTKPGAPATDVQTPMFRKPVEVKKP